LKPSVETRKKMSDAKRGKVGNRKGTPVSLATRQRISAANSRLTVRDVEQIRSLRAQGVKQRLIAEQFGIDQSHVSNICAGKQHSEFKEN
jgi:DNA invertase Pin-like site-specific DNA recombinase